MKTNRTVLSESIGRALHGFCGDASFADAATMLFSALGYESTRTILGLSGDVDEFLAYFAGSGAGDTSRKLLNDHWQSAHLLFQFTDGEMRATNCHRQGAWNGSQRHFDKGRYESFVFLAADLKKRGNRRPSNSGLIRMTRGVNTLFAMPAITLFRSGDDLSITTASRRPNKWRTDKDVLERVTLIKNVSASNPYPGHLDILADLSLHRIMADAAPKPSNFNELLVVWENALSVSMTYKFHRESRQWYNRQLAMGMQPRRYKRF